MALLKILLLLHFVLVSLALPSNPTAGFKEQNIAVKIHKPYDVNLEDRFSFQDGVFKLWVYKSDKPFRAGSPTKPRTEFMFQNMYETGIWEFEADFYVPSGTTGVCIMQVFGGIGSGATALMLRVYDGRLVRSGGSMHLANMTENIYDKWIHLNVIHDADAKNIKVFLDGEKKWEEQNESNKTHYFKCGVYTQNDSSERMESRWRHIKIWKK